MQGTLAAELLTNPREVLAADGRVLKVRSSISAFSFSAHADYSQTSGFLEALAPAHVVLCHGNVTEMERLQKALVKQAATANVKREIHTPRVRHRAQHARQIAAWLRTQAALVASLHAV